MQQYITWYTVENLVVFRFMKYMSSGLFYLTMDFESWWWCLCKREFVTSVRCKDSADCQQLGLTHYMSSSLIPTNTCLETCHSISMSRFYREFLDRKSQKKCLTKVVKTEKKQRITEIIRKDNIDIENTKIQNDNEKEEDTGRHSILICH